MGTTSDSWTCGALTCTTVTASGALTGTSLTLSGVPSTTDSNAKLFKRFIPWQNFITSQTSGAATTLVADGGGAPVSAGSLASTPVGGIFFDAANDTVACLIPIPYDLDVTAAVTFEVPMHFAAATQSGDSITLSLIYDQYVPNTTALAAAATVASPDFSARAWAVDDAIHVATGATIAANTLTVTNYLQLLIKVATATNFSASEIAFLGLNMIYTRRYL